MEQVDWSQVMTALTQAFAVENNKPNFSYKEVMKMALEKIRKHNRKMTGTWHEDFQQQGLDGKQKFTGSATWRVGDQEWSSCGETESNKAEAMRSAWEQLYRQVKSAVEEAEQNQVCVRVELNRALPPAFWANRNSCPRFAAVSWWSMPFYTFFSCESFAGDAKSSEYIVAADTQSNGSGEEFPASATGSASANVADNAAFSSFTAAGMGTDAGPRAASMQMCEDGSRLGALMAEIKPAAASRERVRDLGKAEMTRSYLAEVEDEEPDEDAVAPGSSDSPLCDTAHSCSSPWPEMGSQVGESGRIASSQGLDWDVFLQTPALCLPCRLSCGAPMSMLIERAARGHRHDETVPSEAYSEPEVSGSERVPDTGVRKIFTRTLHALRTTMVSSFVPTPSWAEVVSTGQELKVGPAFAKGTFSTVHPVDGKVNGEDVVVKLTRVHRLHYHVNDVLLLDEVDDEKRLRGREATLQKEAKVLRWLSECPVVVPWLGDIRACVGGETVTGILLPKMKRTLRQLWDRSSAQLNVNQNRCNSIRLAGILGSVVDILWALGRMRECGLCHMDITPDNLLWSEDHCQLYLADLGSAARRPGFTWRALQDLPETANIRRSYALAFRGVWRVLPQLYGQFHSCSFVHFQLHDETPSDMKVKLPLADPRLDYFALLIILRNLLGKKGFVAGGRDDRYPEGEARTIPHSFDPPEAEKPWGQADPTWPSLLEAAVQLRALNHRLEALPPQPEHELKQKGESFLDDALRTCLQDLAESRQRLMRLQEVDIQQGRFGPGPDGPLVFWQRDSSGTPVNIMSFDLSKLGEKPQRLVHEAKKELAECLGCCPPQIKLWALLRPRFDNLKEEEEEVLPGLSSEQLDSPLLRVEVMPLQQLKKELGFEFSEHLMKTSYEEVWYLLNSRHLHPDCISLRDLIDAGPGPCRAALENGADPNQISDRRHRDPMRAAYYGDGRGTTPLTYTTEKMPYAWDSWGSATSFVHKLQHSSLLTFYLYDACLSLDEKAMEIMQMLLDAGARVNKVDGNGNTPLSLVQQKIERPHPGLLSGAALQEDLAESVARSIEEHSLNYGNPVRAADHADGLQCAETAASSIHLVRVRPHEAMATFLEAQYDASAPEWPVDPKTLMSTVGASMGLILSTAVIWPFACVTGLQAWHHSTDLCFRAYGKAGAPGQPIFLGDICIFEDICSNPSDRMQRTDFVLCAQHTGARHPIIALAHQLHQRRRRSSSACMQEPGYFLSFQMARDQGLEPCGKGVPMYEDGMDLDALEQVCKESMGKVKLAAASAGPVHHNPAGTDDIRCSLHCQDGDFQFFVVADEMYQLLTFSQLRVFSIGTFSKLIGPGIKAWGLSTAKKDYSPLPASDSFAVARASTSRNGNNPVIFSSMNLLHFVEWVPRVNGQRHIEVARLLLHVAASRSSFFTEEMQSQKFRDRFAKVSKDLGERLRAEISCTAWVVRSLRSAVPGSRVAEQRCQLICRKLREVGLEAVLQCVPVKALACLRQVHEPKGGYSVWADGSGSQVGPSANGAGNRAEVKSKGKMTGRGGQDMAVKGDKFHDYMRLCYGWLSPEQLEEGLRVDTLTARRFRLDWDALLQTPALCLPCWTSRAAQGHRQARLFRLDLDVFLQSAVLDLEGCTWTPPRRDCSVIVEIR
ncbi:unnamed protein product [Symbiodinium sp. CCMP2592]|nr:unnamed protein product [Symbiodinium sp. CCMP2592]